MSLCLFTNNATALLSAGIVPGTTAVTVNSGQGALFPNPAGGDYFYITVTDGTNTEIMKCTNRAVDTMTVARAQEGTLAATFAANAKVANRITAAALASYLQVGNIGSGVGQVPPGNDARFFAPGDIKMTGVPLNNIPAGWLLANGAEVSRTTYAALFAAIGTAHGAGNGVTTFNLPNLLDRFIVGAGSAFAMAAVGGSVTMTVTVDPHQLSPGEMPSHIHAVTDPGHDHPLNDPGHSHGVTDPAHGHGVNDPTHGHSIGGGVPHVFYIPGGAFHQAAPSFGAAGTVGTDAAGTGISIAANYTGITLQAAKTGAVPYPNYSFVSIQSTGGDQAHSHTASASSNLPPYYALAYLVKT